MKCLECKYVETIEYGFNGFLGETILECKICNEIVDEMGTCEDFKEKKMNKEE